MTVPPMTRAEEAGALRLAAAIMAKYRGGLGTHLAVLHETADALADGAAPPE